MKWLKRLWCKHEVRENWEALWKITVGKPNTFLCYKCGLKVNVGLNSGILTRKDEAFLVQTGIIDPTPTVQKDVVKYEDMEVGLVRRSMV